MIKIVIFFTLGLFFSNPLMAEGKDDKFTFVDPTFSISGAIRTLVSHGRISKKLDNAINGQESQEIKEPERLWEMNINYQMLGLKKIGSRPWNWKYLSPKELPFDPPVEGEILYQIIYLLKLKDLNGKTQEFLVVDTVSNEPVILSLPLVMEASAPYRIIGTWEDNLQAWERIKRKEKDISPNLVK